MPAHTIHTALWWYRYRVLLLPPAISYWYQILRKKVFYRVLLLHVTFFFLFLIVHGTAAVLLHDLQKWLVAVVRTDWCTCAAYTGIHSSSSSRVAYPSSDIARTSSMVPELRSMYDPAVNRIQQYIYFYFLRACVYYSSTQQQQQ